MDENNGNVPIEGVDDSIGLSFAAGREEDKLRNVVLTHVEKTTAKDMFSEIGGGNYTTDMTCAEACRILSSIQDPSRQEACCNDMIKLLFTERRNLVALDKIITAIIIAAQEEGIISLLLACQLLVSSVDFSITIPLDPKKIEFVRERMHLLDYKNMRDLLKLLLVEKLDKMQSSLTEYQHKQLAPIEELMIDLIDRKTNYCPALFFITEISRIQSQSPVHFLPRVSLKIREMVASFRPLAEIGSMIGRSWMYPITTQLSFSWLFNTWSTWKLQEQNYRLYFKTHLPYSNENMAPQTYLQYILLKQPRGQDNLLHMIKSSSSHSMPPRLQCSEVVQILILEAMCAMEESEESVLTSNNQYNWLHLCHLITYALSIGCCTLQQLLPMLQIQLKNYQYNKAKGELMWILLQFISTAKSRSGNASSTLSKNQLDAKNRDLVLDIFNVLYPEEMVWAGCSDDYPNMVRFFAPASLWINLSQVAGGSNTAPPQKVQQHIEFFKTRLKPDLILDNGVLAIIANAYSNNPEIFETHVSRAVLKMLGASADVTQFANGQLPRGRRVSNCLKALDLNLLDVFTFHAKKMLLNSLLSCIQPHVQNGILPSPALIETICRILLTTEIGDNGKTFLTFFAQACKEQNFDLVVIYADMLNYRLQGLQFMAQYRAHIIYCAAELMFNVSMDGTSHRRSIYAKMEQVIMRQILISSPLEFVNIAYYLTYRNVFVNFFVPPDKFGQYQNYGMHTCPEIIRMFLLNLFRAHKILASPTSTTIVSDLNFDFMKHANENYKWSNSTVKWFSVQPNVENNDSISKLAILQQYDADSEEEKPCFSMNANDDYTNNYQKATLFITVFKSLYNLSVLPVQCYKILHMMNSKDLIMNTNTFVDFIVWKSQSLSNPKYDKLVLYVNEMIFVKHVVPFERFFLALVLRPNDDTSIEHSLLLLSSLVKQFSHLSQRIYSYCAFVPHHSNAPYSMSDDYFTKMFEYYKKYPEYTYMELMKVNKMPENYKESEKHLPVYYDSMPERILPIVDVLLQRSLEIAINPDILATFLKTFSPLYKFHPQPMTFLYKTMYSLDSLGTFSHTTIAKQFVMEIVQKIDDTRNPKYIVLSQDFYLHGHDMPVVKFCQTLVDRIIAASTYLHQPPSFVPCDWRFAEYPPAAQALTGAWIELMASPHSAKDITNGIVELAMRRPIHRPYDTINAIGLLLTGLPRSFQNVFFDRIIESFDSPQLLTGKPSILFEPFSQEVYLYSESRILSMLAMIHSFCQHAGNNSLSFLPHLIADELAPKVQNETQLIYFLRILVPYLQRINDKEKQRHIDEYTKPILSIYDVLCRLVEKVGCLKYEDTVCDLLYQFKYMFVGYSLKNRTEQVIKNFPLSMREKLKFLFTHSSAVDSLYQQQQEQQNQNSQRHMLMVHQPQLIRPQLEPFAAGSAIQPNHPMFLAAAGMLGNMGISLPPQQHSVVSGPSIPGVLPNAMAMPPSAAVAAAAVAVSSSTTANATGAFAQHVVPTTYNNIADAMPNTSVPISTTTQLNIVSGFNSAVSTYNESTISTNSSQFTSATNNMSVTKAPFISSINSIPAQQGSTSEVPPPPPYSHLPITTMNMPVNQMSAAAHSAAFPMMINAGPSGFHHQVTTSAMGTGVNTFPTANTTNPEFGFTTAGGIHNIGNMSSQEFHQHMLHQQQQQHMHNNPANVVTTSNLNQHTMNFPTSMPSQAFMPPHGHHIPTPGDVPHVPMHPGMMSQEAFQRQNMVRFPPSGQMM